MPGSPLTHPDQGRFLMVGLRVITGGGKPPPVQPALTTMEIRGDALFKVLPAPSRMDIAERLEKILGYGVSISMVDDLLRWVRKNCDVLGWVPFYASRGVNVTGADRYIVTLLNKHTPILDEAEQLACHDGSLTTLRALQTMARQFHAMLLAQAGQTSGRKKPRMLRDLAADLNYFAGKVDGMIEEVLEHNGTT